MQYNVLHEIKSRLFRNKEHEKIRTTIKLVAVFSLSLFLFLSLQIDSSNSSVEATMPIGTEVAQANEAVELNSSEIQLAVVTPIEEVNSNENAENRFFSFFSSIFSDDDIAEIEVPEPIVIEAKPKEVKVPSVNLVQTKIYDSYYELSGFTLENNEKVFYGEVKKGDTLSTLLNSWVTNAQINEAIKIAKPLLNLTNIHLGNPYAIVLDSNNRFKRFEYEVSSEMIFTLSAATLDEDLEKINKLGEYSQYEFIADYVPIQFEIVLEHIKGDIEYSLFDAMVEAKAGVSLVNKMVDVFAYQIDFFRDIREGDTFEILIEKRYRNGKFYGYGDAIAMVFVNQGKRYAAYQHEIGDKGRGYYDEDGDALERLLLRTPLNYSRISSGYSMARKHPILDITRPHQGIDYAAPYGTPVRTVGDGTIKYIGWKGDYGNTVIVTHSNGLETQYAHLSKFSSGLKKGSKVSQGETIAFVGSTGLSTGPHLDFRLRQNGKFVNPQSIIIPKSPPLEGAEKEEFLANLAIVHAYLEGSKSLATYIADPQQ